VRPLVLAVQLRLYQCGWLSSVTKLALEWPPPERKCRRDTRSFLAPRFAATDPARAFALDTTNATNCAQRANKENAFDFVGYLTYSEFY
jgi:hypothetical protein